MSEFTPDIEIKKGHPLFRHITVYFKGELHKRVFEARVKLESFERPAFGELLVGCIPDTASVMRPPHLGEIDYDGLWCHFECGQVYLELDDEGRQVLEKIRPYIHQYNDYV